MSDLTCATCGTVWNAAQTPLCPTCQTKSWASSPRIVTQKHDPSVLPSALDKFRSVLSNELVADKDAFFGYAAVSGTWYWSIDDQKYCHFTPYPLGQIPGSAIPANYPMPNAPLGGLLIADANNTGYAHAYAEDIQIFHAEIAKQKYIELSRCEVPNCENKSLPGSPKCAKHHSPPLVK
jgi:hypothetical protein